MPHSLPRWCARVPSLKASLCAPKDPGPQPHTLPTLLHGRACPRCSWGSCLEQSETQHSPKSFPCPAWDGSTQVMPWHLPPLHFFYPQPPSQPPARAGPHQAHGAQHMVSLGPARVTVAAPTTVPPTPGERKTDLCKGQLMRKLFASRSARSTGEEQGSSRVAGLSDDNKAAQPEHATSSNARLLPLFWENKRGTRPFLAQPEAVPHLHQLSEEPSTLPCSCRRRGQGSPHPFCLSHLCEEQAWRW